MAVISQASHSVTDFNDAPVIDVFIQNNDSLTQIYNEDNNSYQTNDWSNALTRLILTPYVTISGRTGNQTTNPSSSSAPYVSAVTWYYINTSGVRVQINPSVDVTGTPTAAGAAVVGTDFTVVNGSTVADTRTLTFLKNAVGGSAGSGVNQNTLQSTGIIGGNTVNLVCVVDVVDPIFGALTRERSVTIQSSYTAGSTFIPLLSSNRGNFFSPNQSDPIVLTANFYLGGNDLTEEAGVTFNWVRPLEATLGTAIAGTGSSSSTYTGAGTSALAADYGDNQLRVSRDDVAGAEIYQCEITFEGTTYLSQTFSINDVTDEFRVITPNNLTIRNGAASVTGRYALIKNGVRLQTNPGVSWFMDFKRFVDNGSGITQGQWDTNVTASSRVSGTGLTASYESANQVLRVTYGAGATDSAIDLVLTASDIDSGALNVTLIEAEINDNT